MRIAPQLARLLVLAMSVGALSGCRSSDTTTSNPSPGPSASAAAQPKEIVLPGIDISPMTPRERGEWSSLVGELLAPCSSVPVPLAQCVLEKRGCATCLPAAKFVARAIREGASESQIRRAYEERFDPAMARSIPLSGSPSKGPEDAPVTIVELADFECPHCRLAVPMIDAVFAAHPGKVRVVYKFVELSMHSHSEAASRAAYAAAAQGKFWEMEHLLFERQMHLEQDDLERYAKMLKLDVPKWKADMMSAATSDRLAQDKKLVADLQIKGTPTIYINGRQLDIEADESLEDRVSAELGVAPTPAPSPSASAATTSTPAATPTTSAVAATPPASVHAR